MTTHIILINTLGIQHPPFPYTSLDLALAAASVAVETKIFRTPEVTIQLGSGSTMEILSQEAASERTAREAPPDGSWVLMLHLGRKQLPAMFCESEYVAEQTIDQALETGVFRFIYRDMHEYLWAFVGPGTFYLKFSAEDYRAQIAASRTAQLEERQRQAAAARPPEEPRIILAGSGGPKPR